MGADQVSAPVALHPTGRAKQRHPGLLRSLPVTPLQAMWAAWTGLYIYIMHTIEINALQVIRAAAPGCTAAPC